MSCQKGLASFSFSQRGFAPLALFLIATAFGLVAFTTIKLQSQSGSSPSVKGVLLVEHGSDDSSSGGGSSGGSSSSGSGSSGSSGSNSSSGSSSSGGGSSSGGDSSGGSSGSGDHGSSGSGDFTTSNTGGGGGSVSNNATVECVGPDGKHFQATLQACSDLNKSWNKATFEFKVEKAAPVGKPEPKQERIKQKNEQAETKAPQKEPKENAAEAEKSEVENELEKPETAEVEVKELNGLLEAEAKDATGAARAIGLQKGRQVKLAVKIKGTAGKKQEVELKAEKDTLEIDSNGESAQTQFPIAVDKATGGLVVNTPKGPKPIRVLPDEAANIARHAGILNKIDKIELKANDVLGTNDDLVFKANGEKVATLFGLLPVEIPIDVEVGAQTATVVGSHRPALFSLLSPFIR